MADLARRVRNALAFGATTAPVVAAAVPEVQVRLTPIEVLTLRLVEQRGVASNLPVGTPVLALFQSGDRSNGVIVGSVAPGARPALDGAEDVALYGYGFTVRIAADGIHLSGAPTVFIDGDLVVQGDVTARAGAAPVTLSQHRHPGNQQPPLANT